MDAVVFPGRLRPGKRTASIGGRQNYFIKFSFQAATPQFHSQLQSRVIQARKKYRILLGKIKAKNKIDTFHGGDCVCGREQQKLITIDEYCVG